MLHRVGGQQGISATYCNTYRRRFDIRRAEREASHHAPRDAGAVESRSAVMVLALPTDRCERHARVVLWRRMSADVVVLNGLRGLLQNALPIGIQYAYVLQWSCRLSSGEDGR